MQVDELDRATGVAERDPARFSVDAAEIERRKKWTASTRSQVSCFCLLRNFSLIAIIQEIFEGRLGPAGSNFSSLSRFTSSIVAWLVGQ